MMKTLSILVFVPMIVGTAVVSTPAGAEPMPQCTTTGSNHHYDVPDPTKKGHFVGHFDENGVPQSIVTPSDDTVTTTCPQPI